MSIHSTAPTRVRLLTVLVASTLAAPATYAQSQSGDTQAKTLDQVVVTGVRASNRTSLDSPVPVDVLSEQDLRNAGAVNGELGAVCTMHGKLFSILSFVTDGERISRIYVIRNPDKLAGIILRGL